MLISGDVYGSGHSAAGHTPTKILCHAQDISITLGPNELSAYQHDPTKGALQAEQEPWKNGGCLNKVFLFCEICMASYGMMWFRLFEEWSENKFVMHIF